jgi:hypothetical protein
MMSTRRLSLIEVVLLSALLIGCSSRIEPNVCKMDTLLLNLSAFPGTAWEETGSRDTRDAPSRIGIERAGTSFSTKTQGGAVHIIYRFSDEQEAEENYKQLLLDWFNLAPQGSAWISPSELNNISLNADEYRLDCSKKIIDSCWLLARYKTYIIELKVDMPAFTYIDLTNILKTIDQKMMGCLDS